MKLKVKVILLLILPSLSVAQYHDAQWVFEDYKLDFRRNNDSIVVYTGNIDNFYFDWYDDIIFKEESYRVHPMVPHHFDYCYPNGDLFVHINMDSTWINGNLLSTIWSSGFVTFDFKSQLNENWNNYGGNIRLMGGFYKLKNSIRLYRPFFKHNDLGVSDGHSLLAYDDIEIDRSKKSINLDFKLGIDSISSFTLMPYVTPDKHWIIGHKNNFINSYISENGIINRTPLNMIELKDFGLDSTNVNYRDKNVYNYFRFKSSPNGKFLLAHNTREERTRTPKIFLFTFDIESGELSLVTYFEDLYSSLGSQHDVLFNFSPNSNYIYIQSKMDLLQYDISKLDSNSIHISKTVITKLDTNLSGWHTRSSDMTNFLIGPNGKLYYRYHYLDWDAANRDTAYQYFSIINRPDKKGIKSDFKLKELKFNYIRYNTEQVWKPFQTPWNRLQPPHQMIGRTVSYCEGEDAYLNNVWEDRFVGTNFKWELLNLESNDTLLAAEINKYFEDNPDIKDPFFSDATHNYEGKYYITWTDTLGYNRERIVNLYVDTLPKVEIVSTKLTGDCERERYRLEAGNIIERYEYRWSTGETTPIIEVDKAGEYKLYVTSFQGCIDSSSIDIQFEDEELYLEILGGNKLCYGGELTLSANQDYISYHWNTDETSKSIEINETGRYILTVETSKGCTISDTIDITYQPKVQAQLKPTPTTICNGDSTLLESKYDVAYYSYDWNTGATSRGIYVSESGDYKLIITDTKTGCIDSTEIAIKVEDNLQPTITGSNICSGESATLEALPNDPSYTYLWSNGESTPIIVVSQAGTYSVTVSKAGCVGTAEFTVNESPTPEFEILGESIICNNETAALTSDKDFAEYLWSTNEITKDIEVKEAGTYTLTVTDENGCSATKSFTVEKYELSFDISKGSIDFGKVYITETKSESVEIVNNSGVDVVFEAGTNFIKVFDGQTYKIDYPFIPSQLGAYNNELTLKVTEPCDTVITIPITARVYARTTISTKDIYTQIGQTETVPIYFACEADLPAQEYTITTDIDRTAFFTNDSYTINQTQPISQRRTEIYNLNGTILLSDDLEYDITFPNYTFTNPYIEVIEQPGRIYIDSVCVFDFRNIQFVDPTTLDISPNPASEQLNIDITTGVQGTMKLELVATDGRVIYSDKWMQSTKSKQMQINTMNIPSGLYQVRLITPYDAITKSVVVVE